ncbi:DUF6093 family protein [Kitasatospora sp. NBC_01560]|uniref:DUF6093 family protein n=1 Tax=Kitasatospora sp. NBC_01560 TaxID=2975965 RepID=UPI00386A2D97
MSTPPPPGLLPAGLPARVERLILQDEVVRISEPGPQVLDPATGQYVPGADVVRYEGPGLHRASDGPGVVVRPEGLPYVRVGDGRYLLLTPLSAPVAVEGNRVTVVKSRDPAAVGRTFRVLDPGETGAMSVVRTTWMQIE